MYKGVESRRGEREEKKKYKYVYGVEDEKEREGRRKEGGRETGEVMLLLASMGQRANLWWGDRSRTTKK